MRLTCERLPVLFNALYDKNIRQVPVSHPSEEIGKLFEINLSEANASTVKIRLNKGGYSTARKKINGKYGSPAVNEIPKVRPYVNAFLAGGLLSPANKNELLEFFEQNGYPDLSEGHHPVVAGFDTNLLPWRIANVLGLEPAQDGVINGFVLATGVLDELDWDKKRKDTQSLERAFGPEFNEFWNQQAGWRRESRLGETNYRKLRDHRYADEVISEPGDEEIVSAVANYQQENQRTVLLFSNDRDFVERAKAYRIRARRVEFPRSLSQTLEGSWREIADTLYQLTVLFGVLKLPNVTLYGIWKGKEGQAWHDEELKCNCDNSELKQQLERDIRILDSVS